MKEEFGKDYMKSVELKSSVELKPSVTETKPKTIDDGQREFFTPEYRREGAFLLNHKVENNNSNNVELKTSVTNDKKED